MYSASKFGFGVALCLGAVLAGVSPASATCTRLAFSVNDYGKEGPTKDAKALLDKYIAKWTAERGIKTYRTGAKTVNCELFLNFIVFDEHTCKAEATVCWNEPAAPGAPAQPTAAGPQVPKSAVKPAAKPASAPGAKKPADPGKGKAAAVAQ